ncbi:MAG: radical SAM protein [Acidobacteriaceae bacterium]|nr:radical SAM protein [Acidobacteriaceae bacterium]
MASTVTKAWDILKLIPRGGPSLCNIAVTNSCNATCDFCNFAYNKHRVGNLHWIDADEFDRALDILHGRYIRYVSFFGGEPLLHPRLPEMVAMVVARNMAAAVITNGWLLPARLEQLAKAGLKTVYISIDSARMDEHEINRGLNGVGERIRAANARMPALGMTPLAQITMNKLISDYHALVPVLRDLGFAAVAFSYPQKVKLGSTTLAWSSDSALVNFTDPELVSAFDAVNDLRNELPVNNPRASVADMKRHLRGEPERFVCYGGYKSFYIDWNYDVWRCDAWSQPMCSVWDFADTPLIRDGCTACIADCYRDSSVMLHFAVSLGDALDHIGKGRVLAALRVLADQRNVSSLAAIAENAGILSRLAKVGH